MTSSGDTLFGKATAKHIGYCGQRHQSRWRFVLSLFPLCYQVGAIIGKAGTIVKQIRDETGGRIRVVDGVPGCEERVIVISSPNVSAGEYNNAQVRSSLLSDGFFNCYQLCFGLFTDGHLQSSTRPCSSHFFVN